MIPKNVMGKCLASKLLRRSNETDLGFQVRVLEGFSPGSISAISWASTGLFFGCGGAEFLQKLSGKRKNSRSPEGPGRREKAVVRKRVVHATLGEREESEWIRNRLRHVTGPFSVSPVRF